MCCATINCPNNPKILAGTLSTMRSVKEAVADVQRRVFLLEGFVSSTPDPVVVCSACYNYPQNVHDTGLVHKEETLSAAQRVQLASIEYFFGRVLLAVPVRVFGAVMRALLTLDGGVFDSCAEGLSDRLQQLEQVASSAGATVPASAIPQLAEGWVAALSDMRHTKVRKWWACKPALSDVLRRLAVERRDMLSSAVTSLYQSPSAAPLEQPPEAPPAPLPSATCRRPLRCRRYHRPR